MKNSLRIPRIIHQTWKTKDVPSPLDQLPQHGKNISRIGNISYGQMK